MIENPYQSPEAEQDGNMPSSERVGFGRCPNCGTPIPRVQLFFRMTIPFAARRCPACGASLRVSFVATIVTCAVAAYVIFIAIPLAVVQILMIWDTDSWIEVIVGSAIFVAIDAIWLLVGYVVIYQSWRDGIRLVDPPDGE